MCTENYTRQLWWLCAIYIFQGKKFISAPQSPLLPPSGDLFVQNEDAEKRRRLIKSLRYFAHISGATLVCTSCHGSRLSG